MLRRAELVEALDHLDRLVEMIDSEHFNARPFERARLCGAADALRALGPAC